MEIIVNHGFTKSELQKINRCRLYLQVTALSEITCGYGNRYNGAYNCILDSNIPHHYIWPIQPRPSVSSIKVWHQALQTCFPCTNGVMNYTLGNWLYRPGSEWNWFFSLTSQLIYQRYGFLWRTCRWQSRTGNLGLTPRFQYDTNGIHWPPNSVRATVTRQGNSNLILTRWSNHDNESPFSFLENHNTHWLLQNVQWPDNVNLFKLWIENSNVMAVSDSSYLSQKR